MPPKRFPTDPSVLVKEPGDQWMWCLASEVFHYRIRIRDVPTAKRKEVAAEAVRMLRGADVVIGKAMTATNHPELKELRDGVQEEMPFWCLELGENLPALRVQAEQKLASAGQTNNPAYGELVYSANETLGRIALRDGQIEEARCRLLAAVETPVPPKNMQYDGPDMLLARELLEHGTEEDRKAVLKFLDGIEGFWATPQAQIDSFARSIAEMRVKELNAWRHQIREGKIPVDERWR